MLGIQLDFVNPSQLYIRVHRGSLHATFGVQRNIIEMCTLGLEECTITTDFKSSRLGENSHPAPEA